MGEVNKAAADENVETPSSPRHSGESITNYYQRPRSNGIHDKQAEPGSFDASKQSSDTTVQKLLSADRFYEPGYLHVIRQFGIEQIDTDGPITFRHLSTKLARAHGFQRTGSAIRSQVWAAVSNLRRSTNAPNGEIIFWPDGSEPKTIIPFRGVTDGDDGRSWHDVPYPEKLGLAHSILEPRPLKRGRDPGHGLKDRIRAFKTKNTRRVRISIEGGAGNGRLVTKVRHERRPGNRGARFRSRSRPRR